MTKPRGETPWEPPDAPTRPQYGVIAATTFVAVMLYLDRVCLSIVGAQMRPNLGLTDDQFDWLLSSFFLTYALFQLPAGWVGDRYGPARVLAVYLCLWSVCTGLMGVATGFTGLLLLRLGCGLFEAGAYPLAAAIVGRSVPPADRGWASGWVAVGGRLGGAVAPVSTAWLAAAVVVPSAAVAVGGGLTVAGTAATDDGWRTPFIVYGAAGVIGAIVYGWLVRDRRADAAIPPSALPLPPLREMVRSRPLGLASAVQFASNFAWVFIITLFPDYLKAVYDTPTETRAWYQSLPLYAGIFGMLGGGWVTDRLIRRLGRRWGRAVPMAGSRGLVGLAYLACPFAPDAETVTALLCVVAFATDLGIAPLWAYCQDIGGRHVGAVLGWANMWGNLGAFAAPKVLPWLRDVGGWDTAFGVCAGMQAVAAVAAAGIDAARPIRDE
ncbi:MAG: MFS transporter [Gemmataceae bacterium]